MASQCQIFEALTVINNRDLTLGRERYKNVQSVIQS